MTRPAHCIIFCAGWVALDFVTSGSIRPETIAACIAFIYAAISLPDRKTEASA